MYRVSTVDFSVDSQIDALPEFFDYDVVYNSVTQLYQFIAQYQSTITYYYRYIKKRVDLSSDGDLPQLPEILHVNIADYALEYYYRLQRDTQNRTQALQDARFNLAERLEEFLTIS